MKVLRILNQTGAQDFTSLKKFNSLRDKIAHQYFKDPYDKEYLGIPKREYDEVFQETIREEYFLRKSISPLLSKYISRNQA